MANLIKPWESGGSISVTYDGDGDGSAVFSSDANTGAERTMDVSFVDASRSVIVVRTVRQEAGQEAVEKYIPLTFIEATGEQYFDIGYVVKETDVIDIFYDITDITTERDKFLFGTFGATDSGVNTAIYVSQYTNSAYIRFGTTISTTSTYTKTCNHFSIKKGNLQCGAYSTKLSYMEMPKATLMMFASKSINGDPYNPAVARCQQFKITDSDGNVVVNLRPVKRCSDGKVGMLDFSSGNFFINEGAGDDFLGGEEIAIPDGYALIDCISFDGDKLFNAGIIKSTYTLETQLARASISPEKYLYGMTTTGHTATVTAYLSSSGGYWRWGNSSATVSVSDIHPHTAIHSLGRVRFDGVFKGLISASVFETPYGLSLGGNTNASGVMSPSFLGKIYHFRISEGDVVVKDWWPCKRMSDGVEGFWDNVSQTFIEPII